MTMNMKSKSIEQLLAEADELIQFIDSYAIKEMKEDHLLQFQEHAKNLKKIKSEIRNKSEKKGASEPGSGAEGVHEEIDDIVKALSAYVNR